MIRPDANRAVWDPDKVILVRKPFAWSGVEYKIGDTFDWRALDCDERRLRQLWDRRMIDCGSLPSVLLPTKSANAPLQPPTRPMQPPAKHNHQR